MNALDRRILVAIAADVAALEKLRRDGRSRYAAGVNDPPALGVRVATPRWIGQRDPAARAAGLRALQRLEAAGLIERHSRWGERLTHAALTPAGQAAAAELAGASTATTSTATSTD